MRGASYTTHFEPLHKLYAHHGKPALVPYLVMIPLSLDKYMQVMDH